MNKLIFLDVDGVLNNYSYASEQDEDTGDMRGFGGWFTEGVEPPTFDNVKWDPENVAALKRIIDSVPGVKVVISSAWRMHFMVNTFNEMFKLYGLPEIVIGNTPTHLPITSEQLYGGVLRGDEVAKWLNDRFLPTDEVDYVILDDNMDFRLEQNDFFVNTDPLVGLTDDDADAAITILTGTGPAVVSD